MDTSVLVDIFSSDPDWTEWSVRQLVGYAGRPGRVLIGPIVYAEISVQSRSQEELDENLEDLGVVMVEPSRPALFAAGKAFLAYRDRGGPRLAILPDFLIGAHAADLGLPLITRDPRRVRTYFPDLKVISP